jgi:hypothetical protein
MRILSVLIITSIFFSFGSIAQADISDPEYTVTSELSTEYTGETADGDKEDFRIIADMSIDTEEKAYWSYDDLCVHNLIITNKDPLEYDDYETFYEKETCYSSSSREKQAFEEGLLDETIHATTALDSLEDGETYWAYVQILHTSEHLMYFAPASIEFTVERDLVEMPFSDMEDHWSADYVRSLSALGFVSGYEDGTFRPDNNITRAEVLVMAMNTINTPINSIHESCDPFDFDKEFTSQSYTDLDSSHWAYPYVELAAEMDIVGGYEDGTFRPDEAVTRAEALSVIWETYFACGEYHDLDRYDPYDFIESYLEDGYDAASEERLALGFSDVSENWQRLYANLGEYHGMIDGFENEETGLLEFRPDNLTSRAEVSKMAWEMWNNPHSPAPFK